MRTLMQTLMCAACGSLLVLSACSSKSKHGTGSTGQGGSGGSVSADAGRHDSGLKQDAGSTTVGSHDAGKAADAGPPDAGGSTDAGHDAGPALLTCQAPKPATNAGNTCPSGAPVALKATSVGTGFNVPLLVTHSPNDPAKRLFVVERFGKIRIIKNGATLSKPFIDLSKAVVSGQNEQGLLGLAFDPNFETTGRFFVNYIGQNGGLGTQSVVESYTISSDADVADTTSPKPLLTLEDPESNHNGGMLAFGPDACLYISDGDGGGHDDQHSNNGPDGNGQSLSTGLGKILRVDVDHVNKVPKGNVTGATVPWIWDFGMRNPWRFSFDRQTGDLYIGDVGQDQWEEIDVEARGHGRNNYGWRFIEGKNHCDGDLDTAPLPTTCPVGATGTAAHPVTDFVPPIHDYYHKNGNNCVIGGYVYRGANIPSLNGYYLFGDNGSSHIWALVWNGSAACAAPIDLSSQLNVTGGVTSFGEDVDGELYVTTGSGNVYRIDAK